MIPNAEGLENEIIVSESKGFSQCRCDIVTVARSIITATTVVYPTADSRFEQDPVPTRPKGYSQQCPGNLHGIFAVPVGEQLNEHCVQYPASTPDTVQAFYNNAAINHQCRPDIPQLIPTSTPSRMPPGNKATLCFPVTMFQVVRFFALRGIAARHSTAPSKVCAERGEQAASLLRKPVLHVSV